MLSTDTTAATLDTLVGQIVQYRKVGTFRVVEVVSSHPAPKDALAGWYLCEAIKAPKKVREGGAVKLYLYSDDVVA